MTEPHQITSPSAEHPRTGLLGVVAVLVLFFVLALGIQIADGVYQRDFGGHPDEGAHVVTSLLVADYLSSGAPSGAHPGTFAKDYYEHAPKVALGHYPPALYLIMGPPLAVFRDATTPRVCIALTAAIIGTLAFGIASRSSGRVIGLLAGTAVILLPWTRQMIEVVMADLLLCAFSLAAIGAWLRYDRNPTKRGALWFGLLAAAAILTKASGIFLAVVPGVWLVYKREWSALRRLNFWFAALPVLLLALPWMVATAGISDEGMRGVPVSDHAVDALGYIWHSASTELGITGILLAIVAIVIPALVAGCHAIGKCHDPESRDRWLPAVLCTGTAGAGLMIVILIPVGLEHRYLLTPMVLLVTATAAMIGPLSTARGKAKLAPVLAGIAGFMLLPAFLRDAPAFTRNQEPLTQALHAARESGGNLLVVSDACGEGAVVASSVFADPLPWNAYYLRGTKVLSTSDWMGRGHQPSFASGNELLAGLSERDVHAVVFVEKRTDRKVSPDRAFAWDALSSPDSGFAISTFGDVTVFTKSAQ